MFGKPNIDLFDSRLNNKLPKYVSFLPDPTACTDAFNMNFDCNILYYLIPPFSCIGRLLQKSRNDSGGTFVEHTTLVHKNNETSSSRSNYSFFTTTCFVLSNEAGKKPIH